MTEEEAKTKWCPFSQMQTGHVAIGNRTAAGDPMYGATCIGPSCMMWRETTTKHMERDVPGVILTVAGHCGLAGKP